MNVAIVGSGVSGLGAASALARHHHVEVFEASDWVGGHTHTIDVPLADGGSQPVDTGFIIHNDRTYPRFSRLVAELGVPLRETDMSFSCTCRRCGHSWSSRGLAALFAQRRRLVDPRHHALLLGSLYFFRVGHAALRSQEAAYWTLGEFLARKRVPRAAIDHFIVPMGAAIWSTSARQMLDFPAQAFLAFYANHGMMGWTGAPRWKTVVGGSREYVKALVARDRLTVHTRTPVHAIQRDAAGVTLHVPGGTCRFDRVVLATHSDTALGLLAEPTRAEAGVLGALRYVDNDVWLHTDDSFLPAPRARASWNYETDDCRAPEPMVQATYWMNLLQGLPGPTSYLVTLNPTRRIDPAKVIGRYAYAHPLFDFAALNAQRRLPELQGERHTYFAGAYAGHGFHEDGLRAGQLVAEAILAGSALRQAA